MSQPTPLHHVGYQGDQHCNQLSEGRELKQAAKFGEYITKWIQTQTGSRT